MAFVRSITLVSPGRGVTIYKKKRRKRKVSRWLKPFEKRSRRVLKAGKVSEEEDFQLYMGHQILKGWEALRGK